MFTTVTRVTLARNVASKRREDFSMKTRRFLGAAVLVLSVGCSMLMAQRGEERGGGQKGGESHVGGGYVPSRGPAPHPAPAAQQARPKKLQYSAGRS